MEHHRLKPMVDNYDPKLFNELYENTHLLRKKLASEIDSRRFGYDSEEIFEWFTVKFIHAFNKYYDEENPGILKANIIKSLQFFKNRILRFSYSLKNSVNLHTVDISDMYSLSTEKPDEEHQAILDKTMNYFKQNLSSSAYLVLRVELEPPLYIYDKILDKRKLAFNKIPANLIAEYLGFKVSSVNSLRREIKSVIELAKEELSIY